MQRMTSAEILADLWFQTDYEPAMQIKSDEYIKRDDFQAVFDIIKVKKKKHKKGHESINDSIDSRNESNFHQGTEAEIKDSQPTSFINAFQLIATSQDLDLSGLFEEQASAHIRFGNCVLK